MKPAHQIQAHEALAAVRERDVEIERMSRFIEGLQNQYNALAGRYAAATGRHPAIYLDGKLLGNHEPKKVYDTERKPRRFSTMCPPGEIR